MSPIRVFIAGMFLALLLFKPAFSTAFVSSLSSITSALFSDRVVTPTPEPIVQTKQEEIITETEEPSDGKQDLMLQVIAKIVERLDRLELGAKPTSESNLLVDNKPTSAKEIAYKRALEDQALLEKQAGYDGNDPVVRDRMKLPPKVPPYNLFMVNGEMEPAQFDKEFISKQH